MGLRGGLPKVGTWSPNTEKNSVDLGKTGNQENWKRPGEINSCVRYLQCSHANFMR